MNNNSRCSWAHDLFLPTILFTALGGMTWAVRGCSGFGASAGCVFAGVTWGAAWWYIAHDPRKEQSRRYASGWIVLAVTLGVGLSGARGWMQWPSFFRGELMTDAGHNQFEPISTKYGFLWLFIAGMPWAGIGACMLAWTGSLRTSRWWHWVIRIACGVFVANFARVLYDNHHEWFLPLYDTLGSRYEAADRGGQDPNLAHLVGDCGSAITHLGLYLGFLLYETGCAVYRLIKGQLPDWKNPVLILTVGVVNGTGWALCQNWQWAKRVFGQNAQFNFWRCWESSGGLSIGIAYGIAYFLVNRRMSEKERAVVASQQSIQGPNFEWVLVFLGLAYYAYLGPFAVAVTRGQLGGQFPGFISSIRTYIPGQWATLEVAVVLLFGGAYFLWFRPKSADPTSPNNGLGGVSRLLDSVIAGVITLLLCASLFVPQSRILSWAKALRLSDVALAYNSHVRHWRHTAGVGRLIETYRVTQFAGFYMEVFAVVLLGLGLLWYLFNSQRLNSEKRLGTPADGDSNLERFGLYLGLLVGLIPSIRNGLKGWFNIYCVSDDQYWTKFFANHFGAQGDENYWSRILWYYVGPIGLLLFIAAAVSIFLWPSPRNDRGNPYRHASGIIWLVLIVQNAIAQLITGPPTNWNEMAFSIYYALLFVITATIILHYRFLKSLEAQCKHDPSNETVRFPGGTGGSSASAFS